MPRSRSRSRLGRVIWEVRTNAGLDQAELAARVGLAQPRLSDLEGQPDHIERLLETLAAIDEACGHERGHILRLAGLVTDHEDVVDRIATDETLGDGRTALADLARTMRTMAAETTRLSPAERERLEELAAEGEELARR